VNFLLVGLFGIFRIIFKIPFQFCEIRKLKKPIFFLKKKKKKPNQTLVSTFVPIFRNSIGGGRGRGGPMQGFIFNFVMLPNW